MKCAFFRSFYLSKDDAKIQLFSNMAKFFIIASVFRCVITTVMATFFTKSAIVISYEKNNTINSICYVLFFVFSTFIYSFCLSVHNYDIYFIRQNLFSQGSVVDINLSYICWRWGIGSAINLVLSVYIHYGKSGITL